MRAKAETQELKDLNLNCLLDHGISFLSRTIQLAGEIDTDSFKLVDRALTELERQGTKTITLRINSEGGSVYDALAIVGRIKASKARIVTEGYGCVMSAATLILAAGAKRRFSSFGWFMHHEASYTLDGRHTELKAAVNQKEREERQWAKAMAELSNESFEYWLKTGTRLDCYFSPEELLNLGVIDEII